MMWSGIRVGPGNQGMAGPSLIGSGSLFQKDLSQPAAGRMDDRKVATMFQGVLITCSVPVLLLRSCSLSVRTSRNIRDMPWPYTGSLVAAASPMSATPSLYGWSTRPRHRKMTREGRWDESAIIKFGNAVVRRE